MTLEKYMKKDMQEKSEEIQKATFGGGCFWCIEALFGKLSGVTDVVSGYTAGQTVAPTYEEVCSGQTGHAEVVQVKFIPDLISYEKLLEHFFKVHDPTTLNQQGADAGTQYSLNYTLPQRTSAEARRLPSCKRQNPGQTQS